MKKTVYLFTLLLCLCAPLFAQTGDELKQAKVAMQEKKYNEAIVLLDKVIAQAPNMIQAHFLKGLAYLQTNNATQAITEFDWALRKDPAHSGMYFYRALAKESKGEDQAALRDLETAVLLKSDNPQYYYRAAKIHTRLKQYAEAKMNYEQASNLSPDDQQILEDKDQAIAQMPASVSDEAFNARSRGIDATMLGLEKQIKQAAFGSLEDGKTLFGQINGTKMAAGSKKTLLAQLRMKVMKDVYGKQELFKEDIEDLQFTIQSESWLLPEAMNFIFELTANSPNWFSELIECDGTVYRYQVTRGREEKDFNMDIFAVRNEETHNIYNSTLRVSNAANGQNIDIFVAQNRGYTWKILLGNYLRGTLADGKIDYVEAGKMTSMKTDLLADCLAKNPALLQPASESLVAGMKAAIQNLILNYSLQFDKIE